MADKKHIGLFVCRSASGPHSVLVHTCMPNHVEFTSVLPIETFMQHDRVQSAIKLGLPVIVDLTLEGFQCKEACKAIERHLKEQADAK